MPCNTYVIVFLFIKALELCCWTWAYRASGHEMILLRGLWLVSCSLRDDSPVRMISHPLLQRGSSPTFTPKSGDERAMGNHCYICLSGLGTSGNAAGVQAIAPVSVFPCQLRAGPSTCPGDKEWVVREVEGGRGGTVAYHLFSKQSSRGSLINHTSRCRK